MSDGSGGRDRLGEVEGDAGTGGPSGGRSAGTGDPAGGCSRARKLQKVKMIIPRSYFGNITVSPYYRRRSKFASQNK